MRRALQKQLPALSHWFGLRPSDLDDMWPGEAAVYLDALRDIDRERRKKGR